MELIPAIRAAWRPGSTARGRVGRGPVLGLLAFSLGCLAGCNEEKFSRYPSLEVPGYEIADYLAALSDPNPEIVYNAVCRLGAEGRGLGEALGGSKVDPTTAKYRTAQAVYDKVRALLQARDPQVVAASLRFLQLFSAEYKPKAELVEPVGRVQSVHPLVQYEQVAALGVLVSEEVRPPEAVVRRLLASPSWIVSRSAYQLVSRMPGSTLRRELAGRYRSTGDERERLLLLTVFAAELTPEEISLLKQEALGATSPRIRRAAAELIGANVDPSVYLPWVVEHYGEWSPEDRERWFEVAVHSDKEPVVRLVCQFLAKGHVPSEDALQSLSAKMERVNGELPTWAAEIDQAVRATPALAGRWETMRRQAADARARYAALRQEYEPLAAEFTTKARGVLTKHAVPAAEQEELFKGVADLSRLARP